MTTIAPKITASEPVMTDLPTDVWKVVQRHIVQPKTHIVLSQICTASRQVYSSDTSWKLLCRSLGFGRSVVSKKSTWRETYHRVVAHQVKCDFPACSIFGVPNRDRLGDLLVDRQAALNHAAQFPMLSSTDREALNEAIEDSDLELVHRLMTKFKNATVLDESALSKLLPLSRQNAAKVPPIPEPHRHLTTMGGVFFHAFLDNEIAALPGIHAGRHRHEVPSGAWSGYNWDEDDRSNDRAKLTHNLEDHPLLLHAFATNPPTTELRFTIAIFSLMIKNPSGVTLGDVTYRLRSWCNGLPTRKERKAYLSTPNVTMGVLAAMITGLPNASLPYTRLQMLEELANACEDCGSFHLAAQGQFDDENGEMSIVACPITTGF